jgi:hypothetical protein
VVETIDDTPAATPVPDAALHAPPAPGDQGAEPTPAPAPDRLQVSGWTRLLLSTGTDRAGFHRDSPDPLAVPYDQLVNRNQLSIQMRYARGNDWETVASALLGYNVFEQDADLGKEFSGFNGASTRTAFEPQLREAYVGVFWPSVDVRIGQQRLAWGRGDAITPNDIVNPRDTRDPFLSETELLHIPTFMLRTDFDLRFATLQTVYSPFFVPNRLDVYGGNWAVVQPDAPAGYRGLLNLASRLVDPSLAEALQPLLGQTELPEDDLSNSSAGARLSWTARGIDVNHYYHYGFDGTPNFQIDPMFQKMLGGLDFNSTKVNALTGVLDPIANGYRPVSSTYVRRHHVGLDVQGSLAPFLIRLDAAYDSQAVFTGRDLIGTVKPAAQAVLGVEYQTGDLGKTVIVEAWYHHIDGAPRDGTLIGYDADTVGIASLWRWTFGESVELETRAFVGLHPVSYVVRPQLSWKRDGLALRAGVLVLGGDDGTYANYYRRNTSVYGGIKYSF